MNHIHTPNADDARTSRRSFIQRTGLGLVAVGTMPSLLAVGGSSLVAAAPSRARRPVGVRSPLTITPGGTLVGALTGEPDTLDPATSVIYTGAQVYDNIFSKLIDIDTDGSFYGVLATQWAASDETTWVFDLVTNATFHNGEPFTPDDVVYTFERILDPATASAYSSLFDSIDSVTRTGDAQVTFTLKSPFGPFLTNLANNGQIVNQKAIEAGDPSRNPIGTGPFRFVEWVQGQHVTLEKNPDYFIDGKPFLDAVELRFLLVDQGRIDGLRSNELQWVDAVPLSQLQTLQSDSDFTYVTSPTAGIPDFLAMNVTAAPFDQPEVRQAVAWALNRTEIRDVAYFGAGEVGLAEVPSGSPWFDDADVYAGGPDIDRAKELLAAAGITDELTITYLGLPQYPELLKTGEVVREQLKAIGINMEIEQVDVSVWFDRYSSGDYQITSAYQERTVDPDNFYSLVVKTGAGANAMQYSNPDLDAMIDAARQSSDDAERKTMYAEIRRIVQEEAPLIFVHYETINYLMTNNVAGSTVNPTLVLRLENVGFTG
jgi:peptide/nickel transport system substrate-binding protein